MKPICAHPWQTLQIDAAGVVQTCGYRGCYGNTTNAEPLGNLNTESLAEIWNGAVAQRVRARMAEGDLEGAGCGKCLALARGQNITLEISKQYGVNDSQTSYGKNITKKISEFERGQAILESKPTILFYTPSHNCNLRCIHCYQSYSRNLSVRDVADSQILALLPFLSEITAGGGEPLILPLWRQLLSRYSLEENPFMRFSTTTNAMFLRDDVLSDLERVNDIGIIVSLDGATAEVFENIRVRSNWSEFLDNVHNLREICRRKKASFGFNVAVMKQNILELPRMVDMARHFECLINFQPVVNFPVDCSLTCLNSRDDMQGWAEALEVTEYKLRHELVPNLQVAEHEGRFVRWAEWWNSENLVGQVLGLRNLVPWRLSQEPAQPLTVNIPDRYRFTLDYVYDIANSSGAQRKEAAIIFTRDHEPEFFAIVDNEGNARLCLPDGRYKAWIIGIDSVALDSSFAWENIHLNVVNGQPQWEDNV